MREDANGTLFYDHEFTDIKKLMLQQLDERRLLKASHLHTNFLQK